MTKLTLPLLLIFFTALAAAAPIPDAAKATVLYFPTKVGAKWTYTHSYKNLPEHETVDGVVAVEEGAEGTKVVTIGRLAAKGGLGPNWRMVVSSRGLFWSENLANGGRPDDSVCALKLPHRDGQTWMPGGPDARATAWGPVRVTVPAGEFSCIQVVSRWQLLPPATEWYAPGVGLVKRQSPDALAVLKSFAPAKD
ncbi:hypothetical protein [Urbifossiella limnaea]|uniref:DUF1850 domain-containing protein n=1 Tax=Urbifossiella limnaea TaxID=2528023 RepID=A0A517XSS9_9BACT|nr:hypothetical protein [Urbifossiella limnaea]QDU20566.1 hypothetical protein ETAA1_25210 [Urbifossiella limnaea]